MFLNNQQVTEEIKKLLDTNDNENMTTQSLWDAAKAVLRGAFIVMQAFPKNKQPASPDINNLTQHLKN